MCSYSNYQMVFNYNIFHEAFLAQFNQLYSFSYDLVHAQLLYQIEKCEKDERVHCVKKVTPWSDLFLGSDLKLCLS